MKPILITGCARSGTSIIANIIANHDVYGGDVYREPTLWNKTGMYENARIRNIVVKDYLRAIGADPLGQNPLPDRRKSLPIMDTFGEKILNQLTQQGWDGKCQWFLKEAKMAIMWEQWDCAFPNAQWVLVRRNINDIIKSCIKTPFMSRRKKVKDWKKWVTYHLTRFEEMKKNLAIQEIWPDKFKKADFTEMVGVLKWLGLYNKDSEKVVMNTFNADYWHYTAKQDEKPEK